MLNVFSFEGLGGRRGSSNKFPKAVSGSGLANESPRDYGIEVEFGPN